MDATTPTDIATLLDEPAARRWYRRPVVWSVAAGCIAVAIGIGIWQVRRTANAAPRYSTEVVALGNLTLTVTANGTIQPTRSINIGSELSGTVLVVNVDVNDKISKGQVLVVLDTSKLKDQIHRSEAILAAAQAKVAQTGATITESKASLGRLQEVARLSGGQVPSRAELDGGRATLARALADGASAAAGSAFPRGSCLRRDASPAMYPLCQSQPCGFPVGRAGVRDLFP